MKRTQNFQTIHSEGGLLPPDLLRRVLDPKAKLEGVAPEDYGLPRSERLNETITQSWNRLRKHWTEFRAAASGMAEGEPGTGLTNDKWTLPLLRELNFGPLPTTPARQIADHTYAISRFLGSVPVHLVGCGVSLDRRAAGVRGAASANPHGLVQEYLNRSPDSLWAVVSNGLCLRILRDNQALSRQSYLEFDLEAMFGGEVYSDFVLLWMTAHASRFTPLEGDRPDTCRLERWTKLAQEQGTRALGDLRGGVERALQILGEGFTGHPKNTTLRDALRTGQITPSDFHGQLLRIIYRLIFLFVAEDRIIDGLPLLHPRDESNKASIARQRYATHYGTARLREMASRIKGSRHGDLWRQFQLLVQALSGDAKSENIRKHLSLPALGSFLWNPVNTASLNDSELTNHDFLECLRNLAFTRQGKVLRPVDYQNLGAEELGGVYESLLALSPQICADGARFTFAEFAGSERKTSGSYYTPDSLVQCLLDSALDPVVEEAIKGKTGLEAEKSLLALKVCDPAVGSGHFLVGAAHRLARHLARVRAHALGESEPSPLLYQHALRDVIGHCLYGVDINPMAAELCRVSLWLEALEPGKPLSFLDHHIRVGNSLLGTTPELIEKGIPDEAFKPIEGDDKPYAAALKKLNKTERNQMSLPLVAESESTYGDLADQVINLDSMDDDSIENVHKKEESYNLLNASAEYRNAKLIADAWCSAFVWKKRKNAPQAITEDILRRLKGDSSSIPATTITEIHSLSEQYQFFHWHLAFPEVHAKGGFDCVLGNPPWERLKLQEQEWFASRSSEISDALNAAERRVLIAKLKATNSPLYYEFMRDSRTAEGEVVFLRNSGRYPLCGVGRDINTAAVFLELMHSVISISGILGCLTPASTLSGDTTKCFVHEIVDHGSLQCLYHFENEDLVFPGVHHAFRFCLVVIAGGAHQQNSARFIYYARSVQEINANSRKFTLSPQEIRILNPISQTLAAFKHEKDSVLALSIYRRVPILGEPANHQRSEAWTPWTRPGHYHMSNDAELFQVCPEIPNSDTHVALYESKMIAAFDHRFGTYEGQTSAQANQGKLPETSSFWHVNPNNFVQPRYWIDRRDFSRKTSGIWSKDWQVGIRDIMSSSNERTAIASILPAVAVGGTLMLVASSSASTVEHACLVGAVNSYIFDYSARQKVTGMHLNPSVFRQLPCPSLANIRRSCPFDNKRVVDWLADRILELVFTAWDLKTFAQECGWHDSPFLWNDERRFTLRCELDAAFFHLYLSTEANGDWQSTEEETSECLMRLKDNFPTPRDAVSYIMETFPIVRRKDEEKYNGDYRTKRVILEIYDAMQESIRTGKPYQTRLEPPPADPRCCHPPRNK